MKQPYVKHILAAFSLTLAIGAVTPISLAGEVETSCDAGSNDWSNCGICQCCDRCCCWCDRIRQFRILDGCTKCAWSRTWHGPNALATPLREYYIPRPPQCCWCNDRAAYCGNTVGAAWETCGDTNCQNDMNLVSAEVSPEATAGFSPVQFERLGKIHNELDVVGPAGGPAPSRSAGPAH